VLHIFSNISDIYAGILHDRKILDRRLSQTVGKDINVNPISSVSDAAI
jgi:hypothetical protein